MEEFMLRRSSCHAHDVRIAYATVMTDADHKRHVAHKQTLTEHVARQRRQRKLAGLDVRTGKRKKPRINHITRNSKLSDVKHAGDLVHLPVTLGEMTSSQRAVVHHFPLVHEMLKGAVAPKDVGVVVAHGDGGIVDARAEKAAQMATKIHRRVKTVRRRKRRQRRKEKETESQVHLQSMRMREKIDEQLAKLTGSSRRQRHSIMRRVTVLQTQVMTAARRGESCFCLRFDCFFVGALLLQ
jgi:hypothetical protein